MSDNIHPSLVSALLRSQFETREEVVLDRITEAWGDGADEEHCLEALREWRQGRREDLGECGECW